MDWLLSIPTAYRWAVTIVLVLIIAALSVTPGVERSGDSVFAWLVVHTATPVQKVMHVGIYALLAFAWAWTLETVIESLPPRLLLAFVLAVGMGIALEWYQTMVPGRFGTVADVLLNLIGVLLGLIAAFLLI